jgi:hypothetical protein
MSANDRTQRTVDLDYCRAVKAQNRREAAASDDPCPTCPHGCTQCSCIDYDPSDSVDQRAFDIDEDRFGPQT